MTRGKWVALAVGVAVIAVLATLFPSLWRATAYVQERTDDFYIVVHLDIASRDRSGTGFAQGQSCLFALKHAQCNSLEVQQNFNDIFLQAFNRCVLVQHTVNFNFDNGASGNR